MIFRRTHTTKTKRILQGKFDSKKEVALYRVWTYWFLFIPLYQYDEFID